MWPTLKPNVCLRTTQTQTISISPESRFFMTGREREGLEMAGEVGKVKRETLEACMTCPICNKLLVEATSICLCLHTFCRKCIYEMLSDNGMDVCPVCHIQLGCLPMAKLRADHALEHIRAKIFPSEIRKMETAGVVPSPALPRKRKERSLSSLVANKPPKVPTQSSLRGMRCKTHKQKAPALQGCCVPLVKRNKPDKVAHYKAVAHNKPFGGGLQLKKRRVVAVTEKKNQLGSSTFFPQVMSENVQQHQEQKWQQYEVESAISSRPVARSGVTLGVEKIRAQPAWEMKQAQELSELFQGFHDLQGFLLEMNSLHLRVLAEKFVLIGENLALKDELVKAKAELCKIPGLEKTIADLQGRANRVLELEKQVAKLKGQLQAMEAEVAPAENFRASAAHRKAFVPT